MKKTVLMSAAKKARIALAVLAVCGFTLAGAQSAFAENVTIDINKNIICGDGAKAESESHDPTNNAIVIGTSAIGKGDEVIVLGKGAIVGDYYGIAIGSASEAKGNYTVAIGYSSIASVYATAVGYKAQASGAYATAFGEEARAIGVGSVAVGLWAGAEGNDSSVLGAHTYAKGQRSTALGWGTQTTEEGKSSVALGYGSVADEENVISVGRGERSGWCDIYTGVIEPAYRRIVNVADGTKNTDAATFGQIIKKDTYTISLDNTGNGNVVLKTNANNDGPTIKVDASALAGSSGPSFDGTKLNTDIQNVDVAGGYKGTTTNANTDTKDTIAGAINSAYQAGKDYTDKQLTDKVGTVTNGAYIEAGKNVAKNLGKLDTQVKKNADAIGNINNLNVAGTGNLVDAVNKAYKAATSAGANVGDLSTLDTTNKANLVGAVNEVNKKAEDAKTTATDALNKANTAQATATDALNKANNAQTTATDALNKANNAQTTADNALDKANTNATNIGNLSELNTTNKGNLVGAVNEVNEKTKENAKAIEKVNGRVDELGGAVSKLDSKVNKVGAGAAALAALHPMEFDSDNKLSFAAGVGSYHGASAAAIGAFYRPSEQVMFSIAGNMGNGENMVNAGVSFALDRPSKTPTTKAMMAKKLAEQEQMLAEQSREIAELKAMVEKLAAKQNA